MKKSFSWRPSYEKQGPIRPDERWRQRQWRSNESPKRRWLLRQNGLPRQKWQQRKAEAIAAEARQLVEEKVAVTAAARRKAILEAEATCKVEVKQ